MKFWMVARIDGRGAAPQRQHPSRGIAEDEAKRLAAKERTPFAVMEAVAIASPQDPPVVLSPIEPEE